MGETRAAPNLAAPAQAPLQLLAQRFDRPAAARRTRFLHRVVVQMMAMVYKVVHFPLHPFLTLGRWLRLGLQKLLEATHQASFLSLSQRAQ